VRSLVLCAGGPQANVEASLGRAAAVRESGMAGVLTSTLTRWFTPQALVALDDPGVAYVRERLLTDDAETFAAYWEAMARHDVIDQLAEISVPVTVVAGSADRATSVETLQRIADAVPGAVLRVVDGGSHLYPLEDPQGFRQILDEHLARVG